MFGSFKLKSTIGRSNNVDFGDVLQTKQALQSLGHYKPPKHGMTQYPEHKMFNSIERFQKEYGLKVDGIMRPGGETETALQQQLKRLLVQSDQKSLNSNRLFSAFDKFRKPSFHEEGSGESTRCCASGTCDISF
jgi:murein L,D-transpeptidase YcbB/YkuD